MTPSTALRTLADHLDRHPHLDNGRALSIWAWPDKLEIHGFADHRIQHLLRWHDTLAAPSITAEAIEDDRVRLSAHGLADDVPVRFLVIARGSETDLLRSNFALTDKPVSIPVDRLRALVSAEAAEDVERPIVDPHLVGGAR